MTILNADNIEIIEKNIENADENTLVVFDCDNVLTTVKVGAFSVRNQQFLRNYIKEKELSKDEFYDKIRLVLINETTYIVNQRMVDLVSNLCDRNIKHMVATAYSVRPLKDVPNPIAWRVENLHKMGYSFEKSWENQEIDFELKLFGTDHNPRFYHGVLFCDIFPKGACLQNFLECIDWVPKKIIFIDDALRNVASVGEFCEQNGIEYIGIEYVESQYIKSHIPFSDNLGEIQLNHLMNKSIWLKDEEAHKHL